jgi:chromosome segregation ATPase
MDSVSKKVYENFLFKQGINPHIPNYAITQGEIDKLLMKEPLDLSKYIENLSGSFFYKRDYDSTKH